MVIMAVDYGKARTGIAICDKSEMLASPVCTIKEYNTDTLVKTICEIALERKCEVIVVGLPRNMDGSEGESAENARHIADLIEKRSKIRTIMYDERCTTITAHNFLNDVDARGKKRKNIVDTLAATIILQDFMNYKKNNGI